MWFFNWRSKLKVGCKHRYVKEFDLQCLVFKLLFLYVLYKSNHVAKWVSFWPSGHNFTIHLSGYVYPLWNSERYLYDMTFDILSRCEIQLLTAMDVSSFLRFVKEIYDIVNQHLNIESLLSSMSHLNLQETALDIQIETRPKHLLMVQTMVTKIFMMNSCPLSCRRLGISRSLGCLWHWEATNRMVNAWWLWHRQNSSLIHGNFEDSKIRLIKVNSLENSWTGLYFPLVSWSPVTNKCQTATLVNAWFLYSISTLVW